MKTLWICLLLLGLSGLLLGGCTPRKMNLSEFYAFCWTADQNDSCDSDLAICDQFRADIDKKFQSVDECLAQCQKTNDSMWEGYAFNRCSYMVVSSSALCEQYCRRNFAPGQDNQAAPAK